jgi:hypothetical protein
MLELENNQEQKQQDNIEFALSILNKELKSRIQKRNTGYWLIKHFELQNKEIIKIREAIREIKEQWNIID